MKLIVITQPEFFPGEAKAIDTLFRHGLDILHLRKPMATSEQVEELLKQIPQRWHSYIMLHDFDIPAGFTLRGIHLNHCRPEAPESFDGCISAACHSLQEVAERKPHVDYLFLSPIFDSISKQGYHAAFSNADLLQAKADGLIDEKVIALGGISLNRIQDVAAHGFGGVALLGDVWNRVADKEEFTSHFDALRLETEKV